MLDQKEVDRFWKKVDRRGDNECWPWLASTDGRRGYGGFWLNGRHRKAHQVAWEIANGQAFPEGKHGCHSCDNPNCVNPAHIWPGTAQENILDAVAKKRVDPSKMKAKNHNRLKAFCKHGHEFTPENTGRSIRGNRLCRACHRLHTAQYVAKTRAALGDGA